jgi:hypothetical protein
MIRRSITHVLLALLLLVSQQMVLSHSMAHWSSGSRTVANARHGGDNRLSKAVAQDQSCDQCLAFAQIATAIGGSARSFAPPVPTAGKIVPVAGHADRLRFFAVFQSRAPPAFV